MFSEASIMDFKSSTIEALIEVSTDNEAKQVWCKITRDTQSKTLAMTAPTQAQAASASA
jgi:hypothetical protein